MSARTHEILGKFTAYMCEKGITATCFSSYVKAAKFFLDKSESVSISGYLRFYKQYAEPLLAKNLNPAGILEMLHFLGKGYKRKKVEPQKERTISDKEQKYAAQLSEFVFFLNERALSENTQKTYTGVMKRFFQGHQCFSQTECKNYLDESLAKGVSPRTISLYIKAFNKYAAFIKKPITLKEPKIQRELSLENIPTAREYASMLDYLSHKKNKLGYWIVRILASSGARVSEMQQLKWEDVVDGNVVLKCKGNKYRTIRFPKRLSEECGEYVRSNGLTGIICLNKYGQPMSARGINVMLHAAGAACGIPKKKTHAHAFRHFFAKQYLKNDKNIVHLADILGHANLDTTRIYTQRSNGEQEKDFNRYVTW